MMLSCLMTLLLIASYPFSVSSIAVGECLDDCKAVPNGAYQSCENCRSYVICANGCLLSGFCLRTQLWDDSTKNCTVGKSTTCGGEAALCISSCEGVLFGSFQACGSCTNYVRCSFGIFVRRTCDDGLVWNDDLKLCWPTSDTCLVIGG